MKTSLKPGVIMSSSNQSQNWKKEVEARAKFGKQLKTFSIYVLLVFVALLVIFPIIWMVLTSFKFEPEVQLYPPSIFPNDWTLSAYRNVFRLYPFGLFLLNSLLISIAVTFGTLVSSSMAAFSLVHLRFRGREVIFLIILGTLMVPFAATMVPIFIEMASVNLLNSWYPLIIPAFLGNAYGIFLLRQLFRGIPRELGEAAKLDGCGPLRILWLIYVPLSKSAFTALGVVTFINSWNNMLGPLIFVNDQNRMPVSVGLAYLNGQGSSIWSWIMAASTLSIIPLLLMYAVGQKYVVMGMTMSGVNK